MVVGLEEDQHTPGSRWTLLSEDYSLCGIRIVGSKVMIGLCNTRLGKTRGRCSFGYDSVGETRWKLARVRYWITFIVG